jgi:hypothetical protein
MRRSLVGRTSLALPALYLVCVCLVFSFILFEVLDVDGSDFPVTGPMTDATPAHPAEHDIKRTHLAAACLHLCDLPPPVDSAGVASRAQRVARRHATIPVAPAALAFRAVLARASLAEAPA